MYNVGQYKKDIEFGEKGERDIKNILEPYFGKLERTKRFAIFDYSNDKFLIELKSRRCNYNKYEDTMCPLNKIKKALEIKDRDCYAIFNFLDGVYYLDLKSDYKFIEKNWARWDRNEYKPHIHAYIPITYLRPLYSLPLISV